MRKRILTPTLFATIAACFALLAAAGCGVLAAQPTVDLDEVYGRAAREGADLRNPVIVVPGILGTRLVDGDSRRVVWGAFGPGAVDVGTAEGVRLVGLPMRRGARLSELRDGVVTDGVLDRLEVKVLGLPVLLDAYIQILQTLGAGGYRDPQIAGQIDYGNDHYNCFQFEYDWRRDNAESASRLHAFLLERKAEVEAERARLLGPGFPPVKFDLVAHSMGALVVRYYLRYGDAELSDDGDLPALTWAGAEHVENVVLIAPPNAGSIAALGDLVGGSQFLPFVAGYPPALIGTMPSAYQMMPRGRHKHVIREGNAESAVDNLDDPALWRQFGWGLAAADQERIIELLLPDVADAAERRAIALDHLSKCLHRARRFAAALDAPAIAPDGLRISLFAGDAIATPSIVSVDAAGRLDVVRRAPGDGTVLRSSALMDERLTGDWSPRLISPIGWSQVTFLPFDHLGLTKSQTFSDNLLYLLLEHPSPADQTPPSPPAP